MNFDFSAVKRAFQGLEARLAGIRTEVADLQRKREAVLNSPVARDDVKALMAGWVAEGSGEFARQLQDAVERMARNPHAMGGAAAAAARDLVCFGVGRLNGGVFDPNVAGQFMAGVFGPVIQNAVASAIDGMAWPDNAMTVAARNREALVLDERIVRLQAEEAEIIEKAAEVGLHLE